MGDKNLTSDKFFRKKIQEGTDGYIDLDIIMSCNNVKKMNITKSQIIASTITSSTVEINFAETKIRRKNNQPLPAFKQRFNDEERAFKKQKT